jgi:hypothetical protein
MTMHLRQPRRLLAGVTLAALALLGLPASAAGHRPAGHPPALGNGESPGLLWAGQVWLPRNSSRPQRPYTNYWDSGPKSVYVDASGHLHLSIRFVNGHWSASEIHTLKSDFGYGTYTFTVETPIDALDPNQIVGLYTRNNLPPKVGVPQQESSGGGHDPRYVDHQETDFEIGWWDARRYHLPWDAQYVVQPFWPKGRLKNVHLPAHTPYTAQFVWRPTTTTFTVWRGLQPTGRPASQWTMPFSNGVPRPGTEVSLDTWLIFGRGTARKVNQDVVLDSFTYTPAS